MVAESIQQYDWIAVWSIVCISIGYEIEIRRRHHPRAAESNFNARDVIQLIIKDGSLVVFAVAISIFEDQDPIARSSSVIRIVIRFRNPQSSSIVYAEADRLLNIGLPGKQRDAESIRHNHCPSSFFSRQNFGLFVCNARRADEANKYKNAQEVR